MAQNMVGQDLSEYTLVVARLDRHDRIRNSRPCDDCMAYIQGCGVEVEWTSDEVH